MSQHLIELHRSEVRTIIRWRIEDGNWDRVLEFLSKPKVQSRAEQLKKDIKEQYKLGNTGQKGQWL